MRSPHVSVAINLDAVRHAGEQIRVQTGVALIAVIKADAYGLGAERVADTLAAIADEFAYFSLDGSNRDSASRAGSGAAAGRTGPISRVGPAAGDRQPRRRGSFP